MQRVLDALIDTNTVRVSTPAVARVILCLCSSTRRTKSCGHLPNLVRRPKGQPIAKCLQRSSRVEKRRRRLQRREHDDAVPELHGGS